MNAVCAVNVGKRYRRYSPRRAQTLQEAVMAGFRNVGGGTYSWGLRNVSFELARGRTLGVVGRNGAGKSTLLRLLAGVGLPDEGEVSVHGRVGGLLELTAGFHPDLTGRENVYIGGVIRGLTRRRVRELFDAIVDFSEIAPAIDQPMRTYSSGMQMRLAFSVAIHADPEVLLVDEVLAVGDSAFQRKCLQRIATAQAAGCTIVVVSHDTGLVEDLCNDALWLRDGMAEDFGDARHVVSKYRKSQTLPTVEGTNRRQGAVVTSQGMVLKPGVNRFGSQEVAITDVRIVTRDGAAADMSQGDDLMVEIDYAMKKPVDATIFCITVVDDAGNERLSASTDREDIVPQGSMSGHLSARLRALSLEPGTYFVDVGAYEKGWAFAYDYHSRTYPIIVRHRENATDARRPGMVQALWVHRALDADRSIAFAKQS